MQTRADQLARAGADRREPGRGRPGPGAQAGRAAGGHGPGRERSSACWPAAARARGPCRSVCPRRRCCCARSARSAIRGCTPCRWWPSTCRTAASRWCRSASSWPAPTARPATAAPSQGMLGMLINLLVAEKSGFQPSEDARHGQPQGVRRPHDARGDGVDAAGECSGRGARQTNGAAADVMRRALAASHSCVLWPGLLTTTRGVETRLAAALGARVDAPPRGRPLNGHGAVTFNGASNVAVFLLLLSVTVMRRVNSPALVSITQPPKSSAGNSLTIFSSSF